MHLAAKYGCWKGVDLLLQYGANLHIENMRQITPYHYIKDTLYYKKIIAGKILNTYVCHAIAGINYVRM